MPRDPAGPLRSFLDAADTPEVDLAAWVLQGMARGTLLPLGGGVVADLVALGAPHACRPAACTPSVAGGRRARGHRSCCADLVVTPSATERARIEEVLDAPELADDPRFAPEPSAVFDEDGALRRPRGRCVLARSTPDGLRCALHRLEDARGWPRGRVKPLPCRLFPLAVVALDDDRVLLTALHRRTSRALTGRPAAAFPCLHLAGAPILAVSEAEILTELLGRRSYRRLLAALTPEPSGG